MMHRRARRARGATRRGAVHDLPATMTCRRARRGRTRGVRATVRRVARARVTSRRAMVRCPGALLGAARALLGAARALLGATRALLRAPRAHRASACLLVLTLAAAVCPREDVPRSCLSLTGGDDTDSRNHECQCESEDHCFAVCRHLMLLYSSRLARVGFFLKSYALTHPHGTLFKDLLIFFRAHTARAEIPRHRRSRATARKSPSIANSLDEAPSSSISTVDKSMSIKPDKSEPLSSMKTLPLPCVYVA